jgi:hypothetical protein
MARIAGDKKLRLTRNRRLNKPLPRNAEERFVAAETSIDQMWKSTPMNT